MTRQERIQKERSEMNLAPWQFCPSEIDNKANPYPAGSLGHSSWNQAKKWRDELLETNPKYFDGD